MLAEFFASDNSANLDYSDKSYTIATPFGDINMVCKKQDVRKERMISAVSEGKELRYADMSKNLDEALLRLPNGKKQNFVNFIKDYICKKTKEKNPSLKDLSVISFPDRGNLTKEQMASAAVLCGCLLFAETSEIRNPTRGKWEKKSIEKVEKLITRNCLNPFSVVFLGSKAQYVDESVGESNLDMNTMYTPAKSSPKKNSKIFHRRKSKRHSAQTIRKRRNDSSQMVDFW
ncbi:MAG: hypothetical protein RsTaC01_0590 [Candidatus Paraimprobicoccus trichonymphae]|uniref:Uncharacterized protein n=1 Tax=Candidatus Paraimprobicoccus trichonymphae TaxID=3033793 RepID=A0AA48HZU4_9FIRM|nr:MAG: hypothetical protein RsTaC01_0590 [Candidatus Paraimprobicoccus trichonymphae]